jgi:prepilin-type N-terminal cleavage/methylation domain-containing protein/prepilin-type processing-associated H-X9-DG protein
MTISTTKPARCQRSGFSLSELLITLAAIAILVSMLLPVIRMVRESAHSMTCMTILRQMGMANQLYADDHKGCYVPAMYFDWQGYPNWDTDQWRQNERFLRYLVEDEASRHSMDDSFARGLICPTIRGKNTDNLSIATYGVNSRSLQGGWVPNSFSAARVGRQNGDVFMFGDGLDWLLYTTITYDESYEGVFQSGGMVAFRHRGRKMNAVMYDGSCRSFAQSNMLDTWQLPWIQQ